MTRDELYHVLRAATDSMSSKCLERFANSYQNMKNPSDSQELGALILKNSYEYTTGLIARVLTKILVDE